MSQRDMVIFIVIALVCTLLYLAVALPLPKNRTKAGCRAVILGGVIVLLLTGLTWYTAFFSPIGRNWGLGGAYLWLSICPVLYLLSGLTVTICNHLRKENSHD